MKGVGYLRALEMFRERMDFFSDEEKEWLFHRTAESLWRFSD
jgi:hypothetical protein